ncbi:hypothetical protein [Facklamia languida]
MSPLVYTLNLHCIKNILSNGQEAPIHCAIKARTIPETPFSNPKSIESITLSKFTPLKYTSRSTNIYSELEAALTISLNELSEIVLNYIFPVSKYIKLNISMIPDRPWQIALFKISLLLM